MAAAGKAQGSSANMATTGTTGGAGVAQELQGVATDATMYKKLSGSLPDGAMDAFFGKGTLVKLGHGGKTQGTSHTMTGSDKTQKAQGSGDESQKKAGLRSTQLTMQARVIPHALQPLCV